MDRATWRISGEYDMGPEIVIRFKDNIIKSTMKKYDFMIFCQYLEF